MANIVGRFGPSSTWPTADRSPDLYVPVVNVGLANDARGVQTKGSTKLLAPNLTAVIDTGSQVCAIDPLMARRFNLTMIRESNVSGSSGTALRQIFRGQLFFRETGMLYELGLAGTPMRSGGWNFDIIIGWDLLKYFDIRISRRTNLVELSV